MGTLAERPTCTLPRQTVRPGVTALQEETVRPLSFPQERMWLLDQIDPGAAIYNLFHTVDISGPLAPALLARSLDEVVRRHQILRTTFAAPGGAPEPVVAPAARRPLPLVDLAGLPEPSWGPEVARLSTEERRRPFDLAAEPLFRVALVRLSAGRHAGLLTAHPIVFDGGSSLVLWREVAALYEALAAGRPSPLPELPLQYADHALWQRLHLAGEPLAGEVDPWRRELAPPLPVLRLPADFDRASAHGFLAGEVYRVLPAPLAAALRELGGRCGAPLSSTLLAAWAAVLGRTGGEEDLLVGTPVESRRPEAEGLIGPFRNTLVLRARPRLDRGYGPLVDEVREAAAVAAHHDLPLEMLLTALGLPRDPRRAPPFQVMFLLRSQPAPRLSFAGLRIAVSPPDPAADLAGEVFELGLIAEEKSPIPAAREMAMAASGCGSPTTPSSSPRRRRRASSTTWRPSSPPRSPRRSGRSPSSPSSRRPSAASSSPGATAARTARTATLGPSRRWPITPSSPRRRARPARRPSSQGVPRVGRSPMASSPASREAWRAGSSPRGSARRAGWRSPSSARRA